MMRVDDPRAPAGEPTPGRCRLEPGGGAGLFVGFARAALEQSIPRRFEEQVRHHSGRLAVQSPDHAWSYESLNRAANRVAHAIVAASGPGVEPVVLLVAQGAPLVAAILGTLKAGKFYAPLDPTDPGERLASLVADTRAGLILSDARSYPRAAELALPGRLVVNVDTIDPNIGDEDPKDPIGPDTPAYIYYTSGSTGRPKGVLDTHRNVLHNIMRYTNSLRIGPDDRLTLLQGPSFSGAVSSLFGALLNGAAVFPFDVGRHGVRRIAGWLREREITIYHSVPALFRHVATSPGALPALRVIRLEGDRASVKDVELYRRFASHARLVNGLGATECGLVRQLFVGPDTVMTRGVVPVGYAVEDMEVHVLGDDGAAVGLDEVGEIVVRSRYLAAGYWQRDEATAAAFARDPHDPTLHVYRTGDLGRMQADGCLEHLGRRDAEVKVRGYRVIAADVEAALLRLEGVDQATVVPMERSGESGLTAYVVPAARPAPTVSALRRGLAEALPAYALPRAYVMLDTLPLGPNGKVDRRSLPEPSGQRPDLDVPRVAPQDLLEIQLVRIWEELLHLHPIGVHDDFFDLGGDSLLAVEMLQRVEAGIGRAVSSTTVLEEATIRHLAREILREAGDRQAPLVAVQPRGRQMPLFFLHGDYMSGGFYCADLARRLGADQPFFALAPCGLDGVAPPVSYAAMARSHLRDVRIARPSGPYRLGGLCNGGLVALELARCLEAEGQVVDRLLLVASLPIAAGFGWLWRIVWGAGALRGDAADERAERFMHLRETALRLRNLPPPARARLLLQKILAVSARRWRHRAGAGDRGGIRVPSEAELVRRRRRREYLRIDTDYVPPRYERRITLLWPAEDAIGPEEAARWWRTVVAAVDVHVVPGTHETCLTLETAATAGTMTRCLG